MPQAETRRLAAIMFTDIVGFSRQMGANETRTLRLLEVHNHIVQQAVVAHHGHVIKSTGDGFLVDFPAVVHAVQCAQGIQDHFRTHNAEEAEARAEMAEALRLNPHVSLEWFKQFLPFKDPAMLERHIAALRKAGLK